MIKPPFATRNRSGSDRCSHCRNSGIVALDERPAKRVTVTPPSEDNPKGRWRIDLVFYCGTEHRIETADEKAARKIEADPPLGPSYGAPCPMCEIGEATNLGWASLAGSDLTFWESSDVTTARWEHGLSYRHRHRCRVERCYVPSVGPKCEYHLDAERNGPAAPVKGEVAYSKVPSIRDTDATVRIAEDRENPATGEALDDIPQEIREGLTAEQWQLVRDRKARIDPKTGDLIRVA